VWSSELDSTAGLPSPFWQKHKDRTKYRQWELDHAGIGLPNLKFFPGLLSKLLIFVLSFTSFSNFITLARHAWGRLTVTTWGLPAV